jgi:phosphate/sulfate permease
MNGQPAALRGETEMGSVFHSLLVIPFVGFVVAAGMGVVIRKRSIKEDQRYRDLRFSE